MDGAKRTGPALESMYRFVLWLVPTVEGFPRRQRFLLGDRLQATALDVLERLVEATYTRDRREQLAAANLGIEKLRLLCRLAKDLRHLDVRRYAHAARALDEAGRLVGGWRKAHLAVRWYRLAAELGDEHAPRVTTDDGGSAFGPAETPVAGVVVFRARACRVEPVHGRRPPVGE